MKLYHVLFYYSSRDGQEKTGSYISNRPFRIETDYNDGAGEEIFLPADHTPQRILRDFWFGGRFFNNPNVHPSGVGVSQNSQNLDHTPKNTVIVYDTFKK